MEKQVSDDLAIASLDVSIAVQELCEAEQHSRDLDSKNSSLHEHIAAKSRIERAKKYVLSTKDRVVEMVDRLRDAPPPKPIRTGLWNSVDVLKSLRGHTVKGYIYDDARRPVLVFEDGSGLAIAESPFGGISVKDVRALVESRRGMLRAQSAEIARLTDMLDGQRGELTMSTDATADDHLWWWLSFRDKGRNIVCSCFMTGQNAGEAWDNAKAIFRTTTAQADCVGPFKHEWAYDQYFGRELTISDREDLAKLLWPPMDPVEAHTDANRGVSHD